MMAVMRQFDFATTGRCGDGGNKPFICTANKNFSFVIFLTLQNLGQSCSFNSLSPDCLKPVAENCSQQINCYRIQGKS